MSDIASKCDGSKWTSEYRRAYARAYNRAYYAANSDELKAKAAAHYERTKARSSERYQAKRQVISARNRSTREADGERIRAEQRCRYKVNPASAIARANKRRAILARAAVGTDRAAYRTFIDAVRNAESIACRWCHVLTPKAERRIDHVIPVSKGGADDVSNLCCACRLCNARKGDKLPSEWAQDQRSLGTATSNPKACTT